MFKWNLPLGKNRTAGTFDHCLREVKSQTRILGNGTFNTFDLLLDMQHATSHGSASTVHHEVGSYQRHGH